MWLFFLVHPLPQLRFDLAYCRQGRLQALRQSAGQLVVIRDIIGMARGCLADAGRARPVMPQCNKQMMPTKMAKITALITALIRR